MVLNGCVLVCVYSESLVWAMTVLVTADLHLSSNSRDSYRFAAMSRLAEVIEDEKVKTLLILGDITEEKNFHPATLVNDVVELFHIFSELVDQVIVMMGNHDYTDADTPFFYFLRRLKNVDWIRTRCEMKVVDSRCLFLPHTLNYKRDWEGQSMKGFDYIFAHNTFDGAQTEHGKKLTGIPLNVFPKDARVIAGDIHTPQTLGCLTYCGSPFHVDFGDDFEARVLLLSGDKMKSIPLPGPQKRLLELKSGYSHEDFGMEKGDVVKVRYSLPEKDREKWPEIRAKIRHELEECSCTVYAIQPVLEKAARSASVTSKRYVRSDEEMVKMFGKQHKASEQMMGVGLALAREV